MTSDGRLAAYTIFGTLVAFKLGTALWIFSLYPTVHSAMFLTLTSTFWFGLISLPVLLGGAFWFRMLRARSRRRKMIQAEWNLEPRRRRARAA